MGDIAQIGFKADTGDLDKAVTKINALRPAAAGAEAAAGKLQKTIEAAAASSQNAAVAIAKAEATKADAALKAAQATKASGKANVDAAVAAKKQADATYAAARAERDKAAAEKASALATKKTELAALAAAEAYKQQSTAARQAFNAAAGARGNNSPVPANDQMPNRFNTANIAAQFQDIGVTAAMGMNPMTIALQQGTQLSAILQSMENPLKGIAIAFKQIFNVISLTTIAIVALVAAGLQFLNWTVICKAAVNGLADVVQTAGPYLIAFAAALMLVSAPQIIAGLQAAALWVGRVGLAAISSAASMVTAWLVAIGPIGWIILGVTALIAAFNIFRDELKKIFGFDLVNSIKEWVNKSIGLVIGLGEGIIEVFKAIPEVIEGSFSDSGTTMADAFMKGFKKGLNRDYVGAVADPIVKGTSEAAEKLRKLAEGINFASDKKHGKTDAEKYSDIINKAQQSIESLKAEQAALGLTAREAAKLKYETELLNDARQKGINLSPAQRTELAALAGTMADLSEQTRKTKEAMDFGKDALKGFFSDMRSGLQEGKSLWESFGNAVTNVVDKMVNKFMDLAIDDLFTGLAGMGGSGGAGGILGQMFGWLFNAKGNAFNSSGVSQFANGGAFTNSIVSKPTAFAFGNGGQFGVMGEAGPEAVMPLQRAANGKLGVMSTGGGGDSHVTVNVINNSSNTRVSQQKRRSANGMEIDVVIDDVVASKIGDRGSSTSRSLTQAQSQQMIQR